MHVEVFTQCRRTHFSNVFLLCNIVHNAYFSNALLRKMYRSKLRFLSHCQQKMLIITLFKTDVN